MESEHAISANYSGTTDANSFPGLCLTQPRAEGIGAGLQ